MTTYADVATQALLSRLEVAARNAEIEVLRLETETRQQAAVRLYEEAGIIATRDARLDKCAGQIVVMRVDAELPARRNRGDAKSMW